MTLKLKPFSFCMAITLLSSLLHCRKNTDVPGISGTWTTDKSKNFDDLVLWTSSGKVTDQQIIREYLDRNGSEYFSVDKTPEPLATSATLRFEQNYAIVDVDGERDTTEYLVKNNSLVMLKYEMQGFSTPGSNRCHQLIDSLQVYPSTALCQPLPPVVGFPVAISCLQPQYYPIEITGNKFRLSVFSFHIRSVNNPGQLLSYCYEARSNTANVINENIDRILKAGDTIVTQKAYVALSKL